MQQSPRTSKKTTKELLTPSHSPVEEVHHHHSDSHSTKACCNNCGGNGSCQKIESFLSVEPKTFIPG